MLENTIAEEAFFSHLVISCTYFENFSHLLRSQLFNLLIYAIFHPPRKLETQFCRKEPIISAPLTFKCILSSRHKDKHGLKNYRWWTGGKELPVSQEEAKLLLFCTYMAADFSSAVCLFQHQLSPPVVWIQNFLRNGLLFQSLTALCSQRPLRGICTRNAEIKCGPKRGHEDGVTYQQGISESPEPNSQLVLCYL